MRKNEVESLILEFHTKNQQTLKEKKERLTIDQFVKSKRLSAKDREQLTARLYYQMLPRWIQKVAATQVLNRIASDHTQKRGTGVEVVSLDETVLDENPYRDTLQVLSQDPASHLLAEEIYAAFDAFSPRDSQILKLFLQGYRQREIAEKLQIKLDAVSQVCRRKKETLREILRKMGYRK